MGNFSWEIAKRYYRGKGNINAIKVMSWMSILGIAIGTFALILVLSVFNGFGDLITGLYGYFNPELKVTPKSGKTFEVDSILMAKLRSLPSVQTVSGTLEEVAFFEYQDKQDFGIIKGVDENYRVVTKIDSSIKEGEYKLVSDKVSLAVLGSGMGTKLGVNLQDRFSPLKIFLPSENKGLAGEPFSTRLFYPSGLFFIQQDFDNEYVLTNLEEVQDLLGKPNSLSALEIKVKSGFSIQKVKSELTKVLGTGFQMKDRNEQDEAFMKLLKIEKLMSYIILTLTLALVAFNLIGALWMIVLEKNNDLSIMRSLGAGQPSIFRVFIYLGILLTGTGLVIGSFGALLFYFLHKTIGLIRIPDGFIVNTYPMQLSLADVLLVVITVVVMGVLASIPAAKKAIEIPQLTRNE
jgi:lipoprotein-releasing system permease protein